MLQISNSVVEPPSLEYKIESLQTLEKERLRNIFSFPI